MIPGKQTAPSASSVASAVNSRRLTTALACELRVHCWACRDPGPAGVQFRRTLARFSGGRPPAFAFDCPLGIAAVERPTGPPRIDGELGRRRLRICARCDRAECPIRIKLDTQSRCYVRRLLAKIGLVCPADKWRTN